MECHGLQCGFCTPGMMIAANSLLDRNPDPSEARDPRRPVRPAVPVHRLPQHRQGRAVAATNGRTKQKERRHEHDRSAAISAAGNPIGFGRMLRKEDVRFVQGSRPLPRRHRPARHAARCRSSAVRAPTPRSTRSTRRLPRRTRRSRPSSPAPRSRRSGLAWMPTLSYDTQAVLATDKVRFHGQEVAFVIAEDRYSARDALELIDVDYEPLDAVIDAKRALDSDAPVIRDDKDGQTDNHIFDWDAGDEAATTKAFDAAFADADVVVTQEMLYPRSHPAPMETCGMVADMNPITGQAGAPLQHPSAARPPHRLRDGRRVARAQDAGDLPRHRRRVRQQGAGLPGLRLRDRRLDRDEEAGQVDRGPLREPDVDRLRPRLPHERRDRRDEGRQDPRRSNARARRPRRLQCDRPADEVPGRPVPRLHRLVRLPAPHTARSPASTRTRRPEASRTPARSASPRRCT